MKQQIINGAGEVTFQWDSKNIYDVIDFIKLRPAFSLGNRPRTIDNLSLYLRAYQDALAQTNLLDYGIPDFSHFSTWTCGWRKKGALAAGWDYHILHKVRRNQEKAYNLFFELINQYKNSPFLASEAVLTERNVENSKLGKTKRYKVSHFSDTKEQNLLPAPHKIVIFKIGESDSRWTVFYDGLGMPTFSSCTDKSKEAYKMVEAEFAFEKSQWQQLSNDAALHLYKTTFKDNANQFGMTVTTTEF
jgi:hypothetical protein